jgi:hypothetical protein
MPSLSRGGFSKLCFFVCFRVTFSEPFNASRGVDQLLLAGIKRVALIADFNMGAGNRRPRLDDIAARTGERGVLVLGMNFRFHADLS